jgi:iron-sulfur cluster repair protein YtfE (RIC family)
MVVTIGHQHHAVLVPHVDALREIADVLDELTPQEISQRLAKELAFVHEQLLPHMEMAERTLYPHLELLLGDPQAMEPMRREHVEVRRLLEPLVDYEQTLSGGLMILRDELALRRVLYRLFSLMRVHLHEEGHYLSIIDRHEGAADVAALRDAMAHAVSAA